MAHARNHHGNTTMKTIIENNSLPISLFILAAVLVILIGFALALAYLGGVFTGRDAVIANDKRIENQAALLKPTH
jgi:hypothetical protein